MKNTFKIIHLYLLYCFFNLEQLQLRAVSRSKPGSCFLKATIRASASRFRRAVAYVYTNFNGSRIAQQLINRVMSPVKPI
jgi:hypothetical protein